MHAKLFETVGRKTSVSKNLSKPMAAKEPPVIDQEIARLDIIVAKLQAAYRGHSTRKLAAKAAAAKAAAPEICA